jgi:DNA-directed RNA polymerase specialized sigma24 family protein
VNTVDQPQDKYFPKTSWTLIAEARAPNPSARAAKEEFARRYARPVREYIAAVTGDHQEAEELTQGFFADIVVPGRLLARLDSSKGSFRPYLKQAVRNYVISGIRARHRKKREAFEDVRPDQWSDVGWERLNLQAQTSPDVAFHQAWVRALLAEAMSRVKSICEQRGQVEHLNLFLGRYLSDSSEPPSWRELGAAFGLEEKIARSRSDTVARHFRIVLRQMLREELSSEESIDQEIATLLAFV